MNNVTLSAKEWKNAADAHEALAKVLSFPAYYGKNLDALYDCLRGLEETTLTVTDCACVRAAMPEKWDMFEETLTDAAARSRRLQVILYE